MTIWESKKKKMAYKEQTTLYVEQKQIKVRLVFKNVIIYDKYANDISEKKPFRL